MVRIVIEIGGGNPVQVTATEEILLTIIDYDDIQSGHTIGAVCAAHGVGPGAIIEALDRGEHARKAMTEIVNIKRVGNGQ